jgi:hypothetical protein
LRVFLTKKFGRFQRKEKIADDALSEAVARAERGLVDANLGRFLIKQRIGRRGEGRSGGYRTVVVFRSGDRAVFLFGFAKNERDNISETDETALADYGALLLSLNTAALRTMLDTGELMEIAYDDEA